MHRFLLLLMLCICMAAVAFSQTVAGRHQIVLDDPVGDVQKNEGKPGKDVVKVSITSDGENLRITAELKKKVAYYLKNQLAGPVIEMHFNTDNNDATGGIAFWGKDKKGFEYQVDLVACIKYKNGGLACLGGLGDEIEGFCSSYKLCQYEQDKKMPKNINSTLNSVQKDITGKEVEITLPYSAIGIQSGVRMRIAIRESDSSYDDKSYFPEVFFIVK
ncbi:hypothetical protein JW835_05060 [bacterium]|nr:hypothetical protein [bacterium]